MLPTFPPAECFLVYGGSGNAYHNKLRTRCLFPFVSVCLQIPRGYALQHVFDHKAWKRQTRALVGLTIVAVPLMGAWIWEIIRVRKYDRSSPPSSPINWSDSGFVAIFCLYMLNWVASSLWQYFILYFLGCSTNSPRKSENYAVNFWLRPI